MSAYLIYCWLNKGPVTVLRAREAAIKTFQGTEKGYKFDKFKETSYTKNTHSQLIEFISDWGIAKINDYKSVITYQCSDTDRLIEWLSTDDMKKWNEENGCADEIYLLDKVASQQLRGKWILIPKQ